jgi:hypothetical protein
MQFLLPRLRIFFVIFLFTDIFLSNSYAATLRFQRNITWVEEKNIKKGDQSFSNFISFENAIIAQNNSWHPYWSEVFRLNSNATNVKINIQKLVYGKLNTNGEIQNQSLLKNIVNYNQQLTIGTEMGRTVVGFSFLPLAYNQSNGQVQNIVAFEVEITFDVIPLSQASFNKKSFATNSILATGDWFKIAVTKTGFHKLDRNFFQSNGINLSGIDPRTIKVYGNGPGLLPQANSAIRYDDLVENAIIVVGENDGVFDASDYLLMYGKSQFDVWKPAGNFIAREKNIYSDTTYYFITFNQGNGKRISKQTNQPNFASTQDFHTYCFAHELDALNYGKSGRQFLGEAFDRTPVQNFPFILMVIIPQILSLSDLLLLQDQ